jgi:hypothetical protein
MMFTEAFMRRSGWFAGLAILAAAVSFARAQGNVIFHGIPASVTSITPQNPTPGIPASVTSQTNGPQFNRPFFITGAPQPLFHHRRHAVAVPVPVPVYYPFYSYPVAYGDDTQAQQQPSEPPVEVVEAPAPTVFENRSEYDAPAARPSYAAPAESREPRAESAAAEPARKAPAPDTSTPEAEPTTILVFRDGHQIEIGNYAIVGDTLYDLAGNSKTHKILLADLDLEKTVKVNEDRGYEFRLPQGN